MNRSCARCGRDLAGKRPTAIYCSIACKNATHEDRRRAAVGVRLAGRMCKHCGKPIESASGKAQTCSRECSVAWQNAKRLAAQLPSWNGGKQPGRRLRYGITPDEYAERLAGPNLD